MSDEEVRAALAGQSGWGVHGSSVTHRRYIVPSGSRKHCRCGCGRRITHAGAANGVMLMAGCELSVRRWVASASAEVPPPNES